MTIAYYLLLLFIIGATAQAVRRYLGNMAGWIYSVVPFYGVIDFMVRLPEIDKGEIITEHYSWLPAYGIDFSIYVDGLSAFFSLLILGIGTFILIYAGYYTKSYPRKGVFMGYLILFMASMLGVVVSGNLVTLFLFWELTSLFSYLLIGFNHERKEVRWGALQALLITGFGGGALLIGFVLIGVQYQSYELAEILNKPEILRSSAMYLPALLLILTGAFTKSAQFPFHFWLPDAMVAPTPVSAYLHSATMVKAGIFLLLRLNPVLGGTEAWHYILSLFGVTTMFIGAWLSMTQTDIKRILAYSTVSALGTLVLLIGTDTEYALNAAIIYILVHALYKGTLFMMAGVIDKQAGTRDIHKLGGLFRFMPFAAVVTCLALVSMAGIPPMLGFISKELIYEAKVHAPSAYWFILSAGFFTNVIMVFLSLRLSIDVFWGKTPRYFKTPVEPKLALVLGPFFLVSLSLLLGLFPSTIANSMTDHAILAINPGMHVIELKLWPDIGPVLGLSLATVALGIILFLVRRPALAFADRFDEAYIKNGFSYLFFRSILNFLRYTKEKTDTIQHGYQRFYLLTVFAVSSLLVWAVIWSSAPLAIELNFQEMPVYVVAVVLLIIIAAIASVVSHSRTIALIAMGIIGFGITLVFIVYGGVDLPITMILVEITMVILSTALLLYLPKYVDRSGSGDFMRDVLVAVLTGGFMTVLVLQSFDSEVKQPVSDYFKQASYLEAFGTNIVNVILVDFRAFDTLGELTVLAMGALGVFSLYQFNVRPKKMGKESAILEIAARVMLPLLIVLSIAVLLRGHQEPGGGFIGGLMFSSAFILYAMAFGVRQTKKLIYIEPLTLIALGLFTALISGVPAMFQDQAYQTGWWGTFFLSTPFEFKLGTPILFDVGVYLTVAGMLMQVMFSIMEE
jgi:multicomponent Na+:H+ antiporter subunit A